MRNALLPLLPALLVAGLLASADAREPRTKRPTDEERGKELYDRHCEACHGAWAKGRGPATQALVHPVPDLEGKVEATEETIGVVLRGRGAMPSYEQTFDRFDAKRVLEHMAKLRQPAPGEAPQPSATPAPPEPPPPEAVEDDEAQPE